MQLELVIIGLTPEPELREYVTRRTRFAFDRFERYVKRVTVQLTDLNGPRNGKDKRCHITAEFHQGGHATIRETRSGERAAVYHAVGRLRYLIGNRLRILRSRKRFRLRKESARFAAEALR